MPKTIDHAFRIAMRTSDDGDWWIAYLARMEHMEDTLELGRIRKNAAEKSEAVRKAFIEVCKLMIENVLAEKGIRASEWQTQKPMPPSQGSG